MYQLYIFVTSDEEDVKEAYEDEGERLELEDNEPEYEHEEDAAVDYDEKDLDHDEGQEEYEGDVVEEEDPEMVDEMEDGEGVEVEEDDENAEEEPEVDPEEEEHHEIVKEHRKRKEYEVFVGGLDRDATEEDLRKVFGEVGEITEVRLMMNPITKKNKGFAFLRFATVEQAKRAVSEIRNPVVCALHLITHFLFLIYYFHAHGNKYLHMVRCGVSSVGLPQVMTATPFLWATYARHGLKNT